MKLFLALFFSTTLVVAQSPEVPHKLQFADMTLTIRDDARREIQKDVDAFTRYPKSFNLKAERARTYFPLIEKIFAEENVPDDFKFLVIQESALIPDAVSTSNAVGFWQFKDFTAVEMGLRVDRQIDERMNILASSRAAARYLKKNNAIFDNWLYALQSYQMGAGGVMRSEKKSAYGTKHMEITSHTYWYIKKYLAHKIAYESVVAGPAQVRVIPYKIQKESELKAIATEMEVPQEELQAYNKWAKSGRIPDDRPYVVLIPVKGDAPTLRLPEGAIADATLGLQDKAQVKRSPQAAISERTRINGISAIRAKQDETPATLAERAGVDLSAFLKWNDISISDRLIPGSFYLLGKKRGRGQTAYHKVAAGESLWTVSQRYGVQMKKLKRFNRMREVEMLTPGTTLWLASVKPAENKLPVRSPEKVIEVDYTETFAWEAGPVPPKEEPARVSTTTAVVVVPVESKSSADDVPVVAEHVDTATVATLPDRAQNAESAPEVIGIQPVVQEEKKEPYVETQVPLAAGSPEKHVVKAGETLYSIAKQYKLTVMDLVGYNDLDLTQGIKPGQVLKLVGNQDVPVPSEPASEPSEHVVKPTDTVYSIARKYGVTIKELMEWNNKKDFTLSVGEKLKILRR